MKKIINICSILLASIGVVAFISCEPKDMETDTFDINLPGITITGFTPDSVTVESEVIINGSGFNDTVLKKVKDKVKLGSLLIDTSAITILSDNQMKIVIPRTAQSAPFIITNALNVKVQSKDTLKIGYPNTTIDANHSDTLYSSKGYKITGTNLDLLSFIKIGDVIQKVTIPAKNAKSFVIQTSGIAFKNEFVTLSFISKASNSIKDIGPLKVLTTYPSCKPLYFNPDVASSGDVVQIVVGEKSLISDIRKVEFIDSLKVDKTPFSYAKATFTINSPFIDVTIPAKAKSGDVKITDRYGFVVNLKMTIE